MWQVDAETRAMLDRMKAPKKIDASAAAEPPVERKGSAWNSGGTWEEKDVSEWAKGALKARLGAVSASSEVAGSGKEGGFMEGMLQSLNSVDLTKARGDDEINDLARKLAQGAMPVRVRVTEVKSLEGSAAVVSTRGQTRYPYEFGFVLEWEGVQDESSADGDAASSKPTKVCSGTLTYADVAPSPDWEVSHKWGKSSATASRDEAALTALKREVEAAVAAFAKELGSRV